MRAIRHIAIVTAASVGGAATLGVNLGCTLTLPATPSRSAVDGTSSPAAEGSADTFCRSSEEAGRDLGRTWGATGWTATIGAVGLTAAGAYWAGRASTDEGKKSDATASAFALAGAGVLALIARAALSRSNDAADLAADSGKAMKEEKPIDRWAKCVDAKAGYIENRKAANTYASTKLEEIEKKIKAEVEKAEKAAASASTAAKAAADAATAAAAAAKK